MNRYLPRPAAQHLSHPHRRRARRIAPPGLALIAGAGIVVVSLNQLAAGPQERHPISMTSAVTVDISASYSLMARHSGKVLQVAPGSARPGGAVRQAPARAAAVNQRFVFVPAGTGYFRLQAGNGMVLDVSKGSTADGGRVVQEAYHGGADQQWSVADAGDGYVNLINRNSLKALDVASWSTADGARIQQYTAKNSANQQWRLVKVGTAPIGGSGTGGVPSPSPTATSPAAVVTTSPPSSPPVTAPVASTSSPDPAGCGVAPVTPHASRQARNLLCYLYSQYGNHILSGQEESTWVDGPDYEMNYIHDRSGRYPAVRGMDFEQSDVASRAIAWWRAGGIPMVSYHMGAPTHPDTYEGSQLAVSIDAVLTPGTAENASFISRLDRVASEIQKMKDADTPVLLRPFHEAGGTWFWWSKEGGAAYQRLWRYEFTYLTVTSGLNNIVWLLPYDGSPSAAFYPGKAFVDIGGADTYAGGYAPQTAQYTATRNILGPTMPLALHENGAMPDPDKLQTTGTHWVLFNTWHTKWLTQDNSDAQIKKTYQSPYVVTRDEVPDLR